MEHKNPESTFKANTQLIIKKKVENVELDLQLNLVKTS